MRGVQLSNWMSLWTTHKDDSLQKVSCEGQGLLHAVPNTLRFFFFSINLEQSVLGERAE